MPSVTLQQVADKAGVSAKTVSRVVNNESYVTEKTRERVLAVIRELDYQPNISARSLAANRSYVIGLVYDNPSPAYINDLQRGALEACDQHGYGLLIHPCENRDGQLKDSLEALARKTRLDGMILSPPLCDNEELLDMYDRRGIRYVRISPLDGNGRSPVVYADEYDAAYTMTEYLVSQGHERIGLITGFPNRHGTLMRQSGYEAALTDNHIPLRPDLVVQGLYSFESGEAGARKLLRLGDEERPTAIFASNDYMAAGIIKVANQMRINVPYELSICGYDDAPIARQVWPALTTIRHPVTEMARLASEALINLLAGRPHKIDLEKIHSDLVVRESTGPCPV